MISPSGRFETGVKICLSMSSHHPEHWQPSWSVRVALVALIAFLPTSGQGAIGSLVSSALRLRCSHCAVAAQHASRNATLLQPLGAAMEFFLLPHQLHNQACFHMCSSLPSLSLQDFSKEEKRVLAIESRKAPPKYGSEAKQQIINGLHARMLACGQVQNLLPAPMLSPIYNLL